MNPRRLHLLLALAILLPACPADDSGGDGTDLSKGPFRLRVRVTDGDSGLPLEGMIAYLYDHKRVRDKGTTDEDGRYDFGYLGPSRYGVAAGKNLRGYVPAVEQLDLVEDTDLDLAPRKHEGLNIRVELPTNEPMPPMVQVVYKKEGRERGPMTNVKLEADGAGHTWVIYPGVYDMTFLLSGSEPIERRVELRHLGNEPVALKFVSR